MQSFEHDLKPKTVFMIDHKLKKIIASAPSGSGSRSLRESGGTGRRKGRVEEALDALEDSSRSGRYVSSGFSTSHSTRSILVRMVTGRRSPSTTTAHPD